MDGWCGAKRAILWAWFAGYGGEGMTVDRLCRVNETMARERLCVWRVPRRRNETLARDLNRHDRASPAKGGIFAPRRCADRVSGCGAKRAIR